MYSSKSGLVLAFHGCDQSIGKKVISGENLLKSNNLYDWLGNGIYFWEGNQSRALNFAQEVKNRDSQKIKKPFVIGAIIDLGYCLDLLETKNLNLVKNAHEALSEISKIGELPLPKNSNPGNPKEKFSLIRNLDCAVIEYLHSSMEQKQYDSVRGMFPEGSPLYDGAGFRTKDHIQICIRNPNCIKGYFLPRRLNNDYLSV
jgi:hypothetical protein